MRNSFRSSKVLLNALFVRSITARWAQPTFLAGSVLAAFFLLATPTARAQTIPNAGVRVITVVDNGNNPSPRIPSDFRFAIGETGQLPLFGFAGSPQPITIPLTVPLSATFSLNRVAAPANYATTYSGDCSADGTVQVTRFALKTCTITNHYLSAKETGPTNAVIRIIALVDANGAAGQIPQPGNYTIRVLKTSGQQVATVLGFATGLNVGLASTSTQYRIQEDPNGQFPNYIPTYGGDCDRSGSVTLRPDTTATCVVTNSYPNESEPGSSAMAVLKVITLIDANGAPGPIPNPDDFQIDVLRINPGNDPVASFDGSGTGINVGLIASPPNGPANYQVRENTNGGFPNYLVTYSGNCDSGGEVLLLRGQAKTCIVTNTYLNESDAAGPATAVLKVITLIDANGATGPIPDPDDFETDVLRINPGNTIVATVDGSEIGFNIGLVGYVPNAQTNYEVRQNTNGGFPNYLAIYSGDCDSRGEVLLLRGQAKTCIVTNTYLNQSDASGPATAVLKVITLIDANGATGQIPEPDDFEIDVVRINPGNNIVATVDGSDIGFNIGLVGYVPNAPTNYQVREDENGDFPDYLATYSGDCDRGGEVLLLGGQAKTCTVTNTFVGTNSSLNGPPVAQSQNVSLNEDAIRAITLLATDPEGNPISYILQSLPVNGTLTGTAPNLSYRPAANFHGTDSFTFQAREGDLQSNIATVSINVAPVNDAPVVSGQSVQAVAETPLTIPLTASDVDGDPLTLQIVQAPLHGSLNLSGLSVTYTPANNYLGGDTFRFVVSDECDFPSPSNSNRRSEEASPSRRVLPQG